MNSVMVTGLVIAKEVGACAACNYDLSWLIENPSTLLWVDKIILTPTTWDMIESGSAHGYTHELSESIKLVFQYAKSENLIEIHDPAAVISPDLAHTLLDQVSRDSRMLEEAFPGVISLLSETPSTTGKGLPEELMINDIGYCPPYLVSIYASLILSKAWGAQCLFSARSYEYCKYRFGLQSTSCHAKTQAFQSVFSARIPNDPIFPHIALANAAQCKVCGRLTECRRTYKKDLEKNLAKLFSWRAYDEVQQIKAVMEGLVNESLQKQDLLSHHDLIDDFRRRQAKLNSRIHSVFPKVLRFANLATVISMPFAVIGLATDATLLTVLGASLAIIAQASKEAVEHLKSKYSWVGFLPDKNITDN